jgi:hypothetical protein
VHSLAFARNGVLLDLVPQFNNNIQTNLYLYYPVMQYTEQGPKQVQAHLQDIIHYRLGKVAGQEDIDIYMLFSVDFDLNKPTNFPRKKDRQKHRFLQDWTDNILLPAIACHILSDIAQHIPASWLGTRQRTQTHNQEAQAQADKGTSQYQNLYYPLSAEFLHDI